MSKILDKTNSFWQIIANTWWWWWRWIYFEVQLHIRTQCILWIH